MAMQKLAKQVADSFSRELQSLSPEIQARIEAIGQRVDRIEAAEPPPSQGVQSLDFQTLAVTGSTPTSGSDVLRGTDGNDEINALGGNDTVLSLAGEDRVFGGLGNDDIIAGIDDDFVDGGPGNDLILGDVDVNEDLTFNEAGNDTLNGGSGIDTIFGGLNNDTINGGTGGDSLFGQQGNDNLNGNDGADRLDGNQGDDILKGGYGNDRLFGGTENDQLFGDAGNDQLNADSGNDIVNGGAGKDVITGGTGNDSLTGDDGADELVGGDGNDSLSGGKGNDRLVGADSFGSRLGRGTGERDNLTGGAGRDTFVLGTGTEVFYDGRGNNDFALINDFNRKQDFIELPANPGNDVTESGDAGQLLPDAQVIPTGSDTLASITGTISGRNDFDLYQVTLTGGETFSATTVGSADFDTQLFLFDENGFLIDENDDAGENILRSKLPASPETSLDAGTYFLGISASNNDPVGSPLSGFTNTGNFTGEGNYTIALTGVGASPNNYSLTANPADLPQGTAITLNDNEIIGIISGVTPSQLSLDSSNFVFV